MKIIRFKTNLKCAGCLSKISPQLDATVGEDNWDVDIHDPRKILIVLGQTLEQAALKALKDAGYEAQRI